MRILWASVAGVVSLGVFGAAGCASNVSDSNGRSAQDAPAASPLPEAEPAPTRPLVSRVTGAPTPAFVTAPAGASCVLQPEDGALEAPTQLRVDADGVARFVVLRPADPRDPRRMTLTCATDGGETSTQTVDLQSDSTFAPRPFDPIRANLERRPALAGDPMTFATSDLIQGGYGVRPDPVGNPSAYARWLAAARIDVYKLRDVAHAGALGATTTIRQLPQVAPTTETHFGPKPESTGTTVGPPWTGAVLTGWASTHQYVLNEATFNVPSLTPGGYSVGPSVMSLWNGLDNVFQAIVDINTSTTTVQYGIHRQTFASLYNDGGANQQGKSGVDFTPAANDTIYDEEWYCDASGNVNIGGGYACTYMVDETQSLAWTCDQASSTVCASWAYKPGNALGFQADFVLENDTDQFVINASYASDDWPVFSPIVMTGSAMVVNRTGTVEPGYCSTTPGCAWTTTTTDPTETTWTDWTYQSYPGSSIYSTVPSVPFHINVNMYGSEGMQWTTGAFSELPAPSIVVRATGETDVAAMGPQNSLTYSTIENGNVTAQEIRGHGTTYSAPSLFVRSTGEADIVAAGPLGSVLYYYAFPGQPWQGPFTVAAAGTAYSPPALFVRSTGEADVVVEGPNQSLLYYVNFPGGPWQGPFTVSGNDTVYPGAAPAIFVRPTGEADVVARGPLSSLEYYYNFPNGPWNHATVASLGTTFSSPAIYVRSTGEADLVAQGPSESLVYYFAFPGGSWNGPYTVAGGGSMLTGSSPSIFVRSTGEADIVATSGNYALDYYVAFPGGSWSASAISGANTAFSNPSISVSSSGLPQVAVAGVNGCNPPAPTFSSEAYCAPGIAYREGVSTRTLFGTTTVWAGGDVGLTPSATE